MSECTNFNMHNIQLTNGNEESHRNSFTVPKWPEIGPRQKMECVSFNKRYYIFQIIISTKVKTNFKQNTFFHNLQNGENTFCGVDWKDQENGAVHFYVQTDTEKGHDRC